MVDSSIVPADDSVKERESLTILEDRITPVDYPVNVAVRTADLVLANYPEFVLDLNPKNAGRGE